MRYLILYGYILCLCVGITGHLFADDEVYQRARALKDMSRLDIFEMFVNPLLVSAICQIDPGSVANQTIAEQAKDNQTNGPVEQKRGFADRGAIAVLLPLNEPSLRGKHLNYYIPVSAAVDRRVHESREKFSPFRSDTSSVCVLRWPRSAKLDSLSQFPETYLISSNYRHLLESFDADYVSNHLDPRALAKLTVDDLIHMLQANGNSLLEISYLRQLITSKQLSDSSKVSQILSFTDKDELGGVLIYELLTQPDDGAEHIVKDEINKMLSRPQGSDVLYYNLALALFQAEDWSGRYDEDYQFLENRLSGIVGKGGGSNRLKEIIKMLNE